MRRSTIPLHSFAEYFSDVPVEVMDEIGNSELLHLAAQESVYRVTEAREKLRSQMANSSGSDLDALRVEVKDAEDTSFDVIYTLFKGLAGKLTVSDLPMIPSPKGNKWEPSIRYILLRILSFGRAFRDHVDIDSIQRELGCADDDNNNNNALLQFVLNCVNLRKDSAV